VADYVYFEDGDDMKIATMFHDVSVSFFKKPSTEKYPFERRDVPERLRGMLSWSPENCIGCGLCVKDCPASAIEVTVLDKKAKRFVVSYHLDRCIFCGQCAFICRQGCLDLVAGKWELAALGRDPFVVHFGESEDVRCLLAE
jgi:NAD(P)H-quinone oxidoreductase subunit I/formate hydrogenlyase subunit 6